MGSDQINTHNSSNVLLFISWNRQNKCRKSSSTIKYEHIGTGEVNGADFSPPHRDLIAFTRASISFSSR